MKNVITITAILNLLLALLAFICSVIAAINKDGDFFGCSALMVLISIFSTATLLAICSDFNEADK